MNQETLHEIVRRPINADRHEDASVIWRNNVLAASSCSGINFFDFSYNLRSFSKTLDIVQVSSGIHKTSPAEDLLNKGLIFKGLNCFDFNNLLLDPTFWPHNDNIVQGMTRITAFQWSPVGFIPHDLCALATVNNLGSVNFLGPSRHKWISYLNLSSSVCKFIKESSEYGSIFQSEIKNVDDLKTAVSALVTCCIAWGTNLDDCNQCYFVTVQKNGIMLFWKLKCVENKITAEIVFHLKTLLDEVYSIKWVTQNDTKFHIIHSNVFGQMHVIHFENDNDAIKHIRTDCIWDDKDRMVSNCIEYIMNKNNTFLVYSKHRHLIIQLFDENFSLLSQKITNFNDFKITGITIRMKEIYLTTVNCKVFRINLDFVINTIDIQFHHIKIKDTHPQYELYGISFSENNLICALPMTNKSVSYKKKIDVIEIVFASWDIDNESELKWILNNPSKSLTNIWDYIEMLRWKIVKLKMFPLIDYDELYQESNNDIYKLKVYLILITLYNNLGKALKLSLKNLFPVFSEELIKDRVFAHQAKLVLENLWKQQSEAKKLDQIQMEYVCGAKNYLQYYCNKYKESLTKFIPNNAFTKVKIDFDCECCDEKIIGLACKHGHRNLFCSLTFTLMGSADYMKCKCCGLLARAELFDSKPKCILCDLFFDIHSTDVK